MRWRGRPWPDSRLLRPRVADAEQLGWGELDDSGAAEPRTAFGATSPSRYVAPKDRSPPVRDCLSQHRERQNGSVAGRRYFETAAGSLAAEQAGPAGSASPDFSHRIGASGPCI